MAGVREDLILDITSAQRSIDALEAQVTAAFSRIDVELNTTGISQEISRAVDAADTTTNLEVNTTGVAAEITRAVDLADTDLEITADTTAARVQVAALDKDVQRAATSAGTLKAALSGATILIAARGLFGLAEASSAVNEQITGSEIVFGNLATGVQRFADQADRIGLAEAQALQLSNTFGQLALSAGLSDAAVADFATTIVQRGADIASLRDIDLTQTLDALRSGLVGETEPLRNIGIFMNEALVEAEAYRLGIAELGTELTDAQKIQARYQIILDQSAIAAGNFALTQDGLANTQRQIRAELQDLAADSGRLLEPTFLRLAGLARDDLIPSLATLAEEALPAVASILESLAPVLGITVDLLIAATPLLELTADILGAIPAPLLAVVGGYIAWNRVSKLLDVAGQTKAIQGLSGGVDNLRASFGRLDALDKGIGIGVAVTALAPLVALAVDQGGGNALGDLAGGLIRFGDAFTGFSSRRADEVSGEIKEIIGTLDTNNVSQALIAAERLTAAYQEVGDARRVLLGGVSVATVSLSDPLGADAADRAARLDQIRAEVIALQDQARAEVQAGIDTGRFTDEQIAATYRLAQRVPQHLRIIEQLRLLQIEEQKSARNAQITIDTYDDVAASYVGVADALGRLRTEAPEVERIVSGIRISGDRSEESFLNLAVAIDGAKLSGEQLADVAAALGTDTESLSGFVDTLTESLDDFVQSAVSGLPTVADVLSQVQADVQAAEDALATAQERDSRDVEANVAQFTQGLRDQAEELADFRSDLENLTAAGFGDVAALLAEQGFEAGNAFADELNAALESGNTELIEGLQSANQAFQDESDRTIEFLRDELGPELLSVSGLIASAITDAFGSELDFAEKIRIAAELAAAELDPQAEQIAAIAATKGEAAARAFGEALKLDQETINAGIRAGNAIAGVDTSNFKDNGRRIGAELGDGIVDGFTAALRQRETEVEDKAAQLALAAERGARQAAESRSPSKVWERLGGDLADGLVIGLGAGTSRVAAAGATTVASAVPAFGTRSFARGNDGTLRLHPEDLQAIADLRPNHNVVVNNPKAMAAESSVRNELTDIRLRSEG